MKREVLRPKTRVPASDVEAEERRVCTEGLSQAGNRSVHVCAPVLPRRAEVEPCHPGRIGRMEVAAPRLDDGEVVEVVEGERDGAVAARGKTDERPRPPVADRPEMRVDVCGQLLRDRLLPVSARA